jgi:hypothetical protein
LPAEAAAAMQGIDAQRTDLASHPWSVVRNSWTEIVYLANDADPKLEAAFRIQRENCRCASRRDEFEARRLRSE